MYLSIKEYFLIFQKLQTLYPHIKKGEKLDPNNCWPISRLSNVSKLYEKAMHVRLTVFLGKNKVLFSYQFGFLNNYSTSHALISLIEMKRNAHGNGNFLWCLQGPAEFLWHCQTWCPSFQAKPLPHQRSSSWLVQKLSQWQNSVCNHQ